MSTDRDTHFQSFARLVVDEMERNSLIPVHPKSLPIIKEEMAKIIARRAYDLAKHVMSIAPVTEWEWDMRDVSDLIEWPIERDNESTDTRS